MAAPLLLLAALAGLLDVRGELARLADPLAARREAAQEALARELRANDYPAVAEALTRGDPEVGQRLVRSLSSDDRHLGLAALLATDPRREVRAIGRAAIEELATAWSPAAALPPMRQRELPEEWSRMTSGDLRVDLSRAPLGETLDRLARLAGGPAQLVLDPSLDPALPARPPESRIKTPVAQGSFGDLVRALAISWRIAFEVHGFRADEAASGVWIRLCKRGDGGERTGVQLLADWCEGVLRELDPAWNSACARALAASEWPAAMRWLEERYASTREESLREALLLAAGRGRVAPLLADPQELRDLLGAFDARITAWEDGAREAAERGARALSAFGPVGPRGERLSEVLLEGWESLGERSRWLRLVALEGSGAISPGGEAACADLLRGQACAGLRAQAVQTWLALAGSARPEPSVARPLELLRWAEAHGSLDELARGLVGLGAPYPEGLDPDSAELSRPLALALLDWGAHAGAPAATRLLHPFLADEEGLALLVPRVLDWRSVGEEVVAVRLLERLAGPPPPGLEHLRLRVGLAGSEDTRAALERLAEDGQPGLPEARDLGALCAHPTLGWRAREVLVAWVVPGRDVGVLAAAIEACEAALRRTLGDAELAALTKRLRERSVGSGHPLTDYLLSVRPLASPAEPRDLDALDRHLDF